MSADRASPDIESPNLMRKILVTYGTFSGSTGEVAQAISDVIGQRGIDVDLRPMGEVSDLSAYDAVVAGAPMILGWFRPARRFLHRHRSELENMPLAIFVTAMSLTDTGVGSISGVPVFIDEGLPESPANEARLTFRERYSTAENYARPILRAVQPAKPLSLAFFGGRLNFGKLKWWAAILAMMLVRTKVGDRRDWEAIREWAGELPDRFMDLQR